MMSDKPNIDDEQYLQPPTGDDITPPPSPMPPAPTDATASTGDFPPPPPIPGSEVPVGLGEPEMLPPPPVPELPMFYGQDDIDGAAAQKPRASAKQVLWMWIAAGVAIVASVLLVSSGATAGYSIMGILVIVSAIFGSIKLFRSMNRPGSKGVGAALLFVGCLLPIILFGVCLMAIGASGTPV